jgi:hypothetical protein
MTQQVINISNSINTGTGDDIRTAFGKVNTNFTTIFSEINPTAIVYNTTTTALVITNTVSTFESNVVVTGNTTFIGNITGVCDGGTF